MSYYRQSPLQSLQASYRRSPPKLQRELIEEEINLKNALRSESDNRRLIDEISLLQIKLRKTQELQARNDSLVKQNSVLAQDNDQLARQLNQRRYQLERLKGNALQLQERDAIKNAQLDQINRSLAIEIDILKKERLQSNKLYESHIQKLQYMLQDKVKEIDSLSISYNNLLNEKEGSEIKFEEERNKLKNLMTRTSHQLERELEYTKEKQSTEKYVEIQTLKKNYTSQIILLEDEIGKLKAANDYKHSEFQNQLSDNKNLKNRYEQQVKSLLQENGALRDKILKLQELNRSQVVNIQVKYKDLQKKDTNELLSGHVKQIKTLIAEIDKLNWLVRDKNQQIQNLIRDKQEQKAEEESRQLAFRAQIDTLKNKNEVEKEKHAQDNHQLNDRVHFLSNKLLRDSDSYLQRVNKLNKTINDIQSELKSKQNQLDKTRAQNNIQAKQQQRVIEELTIKLDKTKRELSDSEHDRFSLNKDFEQFKKDSYDQISALTKRNKELQTIVEELAEKLDRHADHSGDQIKFLNLEIQSLKKNIAVLENDLSNQHSNHSQQLNELSTNVKSKIDKLQVQQNQTISEIEASRDNQIQALNRRLQKAIRDRDEANKKLAEYVDRFEHLNKYFKNPSEGSIARERGESRLFEVLSKVNQSTINIF